MMQDRYRNRYRVPPASDRVRRQIAREAARRLFGTLIPDLNGRPLNWLDLAGPNDLYLAKRRAAAVLGHRVRPGDLPSDAEVRVEMASLERECGGESELLETMPEPAADTAPLSLTDHLDRFALYKMRLEPLETVKQNPRFHPEGDALFHSLQVFHLAATHGLTMKSFCWRRFCTTWVRPSIRKIMSPPASKHCAARSPSEHCG